MEKIASALLSMRAMAVGLFIFFFAIAKATFIESNETTQAAKLWIYNAKWFEILLLFLAINMIANIYRYQMWKREKIAMLMFHIAFLIILMGAWVTRYISYEGKMMIREGESSNIVYSADPYVWVNINDGKMQYTNDVKAFMAESYWNNNCDLDIEFPNHKTPIKIEYVDFKSKYIDTIEFSSKYKTSALNIVTDGMKANFILPNDIFNLNGVSIAFSEQKVIGVNIYRRNDTLRIRPSMPMQYIPMKEMQKARQTGQMPADSAFVKLMPGQEDVFHTTTLYQIAGQQFVYKQELPNAGRKLIPSGSKDRGQDYLTVKITDGSKTKIVQLEGGMGNIGKPEFFQFNGLNYHVEYGSKRIPVPFYVKCNDFELKRYSGTGMPSSFASHLQILDTANNEFGTKYLFMNHVLDYKGFRFFQSSYDPDEKGTILSVNHDFLGTNLTYIGYLLMTIGMIFSLFAPSSRFRDSLRKLAKSTTAKAIIALMALGSFGAYAQDEHNHDHDHDHNHSHAVNENHESHIQEPKSYYVSDEHSEDLASLLVLDPNSRYIPFHTMADQILRKVYRSNKYDGHNAVQVVFSIQMYPQHWVDEKIIQVPAALRESFKLDSYVSLKDLMDETTNFKYLEEYNNAIRLPEAKQSETQKKLIKLGEKYQVLLKVINWEYFAVVPVTKDPNYKWVSPFPLTSPTTIDSLKKKLVITYVSKCVESLQSGGSFGEATDLLNQIKLAQRLETKSPELPSESHVSVEISYNKMGIFKNTMYTYLLVGFVLMILFFIKTLHNPGENALKRYKRIRSSLIAILWVIFLYHGAGLGMRSYISGHAPWSDGYEAIVFIGWVTMLAGLIFSRKNDGILPGAVILASFMIMVTELNLLDPQITPLQPVLQSYWLMIHVAVITSSYAFLGLSFILGTFNMFLFITRKEKNAERVSRDISELTHVSELSMTIGLFMLTIGTFLGGIWANESWGRYWGWDPKETWALASVLVYAIIMHLRYIPGLKGKFAYNVASVWGFAAIVFTFLGVNFILVGLHSYANGDGAVSFPPSVWITVTIFLILTVVAGIRSSQYNKQQRLKI